MISFKNLFQNEWRRKWTCC